MKMKKKVISLIMLVALFAMQVMSVSAASKTTGMALTGSASPAYELREMNDSILAGIGNEDVAQLIRDINAGKKTLADLAKTAPDIAAQLEGKTLITPIMDLIPINGGIKSADGKQYIVQKISVSTLAKGMTDVQVLHYSIANQKWEIITPDSVDLNSKEIEVKFNDLSPVAVIANVDAAQAVNNTAGTSPKTGDNTPFAALFAMMGISAAGLIFACYKRFRRVKKSK